MRAEHASVITSCHSTRDTVSVLCLASGVVSSDYIPLSFKKKKKESQTRKFTTSTSYSIILAVVKLASGSLVRGFYGDIALSWQAVYASCQLYLFVFVSEPEWAKPCSVHLE